MYIKVKVTDLVQTCGHANWELSIDENLNPFGELFGDGS